MSAPRTLVIWAHPRTDSLTAAVVEDVTEELRAQGVEVELFDVYRENFDPVLGPQDEPMFGAPDKMYSAEVMARAEQVRGVDAVVVIFPIWWYSMPAALKGYFDRVWNYGLFYGDGRRIGVRTVRWIGLSGNPERSYRRRGYDDMMRHHLNSGIAGYCGFEDSAVEFLFDTLCDEVADAAAHIARLREQARAVASALAGQLTAAPSEPAETRSDI